MVLPMLNFTLSTFYHVALPLLLVAACLPVSPAQAQNTKKLGEIEFYGLSGINLAKLKSSLPIHVGDIITRAGSEKIKMDIRKAVLKRIGRSATDVEAVCCDPKGRIILYIGLPGTNARPSNYLSTPTGRNSLPAEAYNRYKQERTASEAAVGKGDAVEDDTQGYALMRDPDARKAEKALRTYALRHTPEIAQTLRGAADAKQRVAAVVLLGYAKASPAQIAELVRASRDPDDDVRDEATRALGVLANSKLIIGKQIPARPFVAMLNSGIWSDRNKAAFVLCALTTHRSRPLLNAIKARSLSSLTEMARWDSGHAGAACLILARIAGMSDEEAFKMTGVGDAEKIISAATAN